MTRITPGILVKVIRQMEKLSLKEKEAIFDEIYIEQPNILASIIVQKKLGNDKRRFYACQF